jgi:hypothetical protein
MSFIFKVEIEVLVLMEAFGFAFPVTTTSSMALPLVIVSFSVLWENINAAVFIAPKMSSLVKIFDSIFL